MFDEVSSCWYTHQGSFGGSLGGVTFTGRGVDVVPDDTGLSGESGTGPLGKNQIRPTTIRIPPTADRIIPHGGREGEGRAINGVRQSLPDSVCPGQSNTLPSSILGIASSWEILCPSLAYLQGSPPNSFSHRYKEGIVFSPLKQVLQQADDSAQSPLPHCL